MSWLTRRAVQQLADRRRPVMLKIFRRVTAGEHPEAEMGRYLTAHGYRQLADPAGRGDALRQGRRALFAGGRPGLHPQPGRRLDLDLEHVQARGRRSRRPTRPRSRLAPTMSRTTRPSPPPSAASSPRCTWCWRATPTTRPSRRAPRPKKTSKRWIDAGARLLDKAFDIIASLKTGENEVGRHGDRRPDLQQGRADRLAGEAWRRPASRAW